MNEKCFITIYKKIKINDDTVMLIKDMSIKEAYLEEFDEDFYTAYYIDENGRTVVLNEASNPYALVSNEEYVFNYAMFVDSLKEMYPNEKEDNLFDIYDNDTTPIFNLAMFSKEEQGYKIITFNEEKIKETIEDGIPSDEEPLFDSIYVEYDPEEDDMITVSRKDVHDIVRLIQKKQYKKAAKSIKAFIEAYNDAIPNDEKFTFDTKDEPEVEAKINDENPFFNKEELENDLNELNKLVGLDNVKKQVKNLIARIIYQKRAEQFGIKIERPNLNMVFTGNPGTGKTTVARLIAKILYHAGYTKTDKFQEITTKDLVGEYVGQTAPKTNKMIKKTEGGVIFLDEAYGMTTKGNSFANESMQEILKAMEKKDTVFIFAGYEDEMQQFIDFNSGFASRVGINLKFEDYSKEELYRMFENRVNTSNLVIDDSLKEKVINNIEKAKTAKHFGNGRYIDKLYGQILLEHCNRTYEAETKKELITLTGEDLTKEVEEILIPKTKTKKIGFN